MLQTSKQRAAFPQGFAAGTSANLIENGFSDRLFDLLVRTKPARYCSRIPAQRVPALIDDLPHQRLVLRVVSQRSSRPNQPGAHRRPPHNAAARPQAAAWKNPQAIDASNNVFKLARPFDRLFAGVFTQPTVSIQQHTHLAGVTAISYRTGRT